MSDRRLRLLALACAAYALVVPFAVARYPAMVDFPFHTASASTIRHYWDPEFHQHEQFILRPMAVPYVTMYAIAAFLMLFLPALTAAKVAGAVMLATVPAGMAVMFHGFKKSPLLGLLGFAVVWCRLSHWGFLSAMGALGLSAMCIGVTALLLDRPSVGRALALASLLVVLLFTHIFRFPFAVFGVVSTAALLYPATKRWRPLVLPLLPSLALFAVWYRERPKALAPDAASFGFDIEHILKLGSPFLSNYGGLNDKLPVGFFLVTAAIVAVVNIRFRQRPAGAWARAATRVPLVLASTYLICFFVLPARIGKFFYVYQREAVSMLLMLVGAVPDLPAAPKPRAALVSALAFATALLGTSVAVDYRAFDRTNDDFAAIITKIPRAPKLLYLVFDEQVAKKKMTPDLHMPAYVQAEKGGWLSFHFAAFPEFVLQYRDPGEPAAVVPPKMPAEFEWRPESFSVTEHGPFFDTFLVRSNESPDDIFKEDRSIVRVDHVGRWWLYRRER